MDKYIVEYNNELYNFVKIDYITQEVYLVNLENNVTPYFKKDIILCKFHKDIGIKDINNNPIYVDCSIVEFKVEIDTGVKNKPLIKTYQGYFYFDKSRLSYLIKTDRGIFNVCSAIDGNFKIIDTIQENKLGLI